MLEGAELVVSKLRALLVGLGQIGCGYDAHLPFQWDQPHSSSRTLSHARALACHPDFELVGGVDPSRDARDRFAGIYGLPTYADLAAWRSEFRRQEPELVVVAVAPQIQPALVEQLLSFISPRMLLLEKPVATSVAQARDLERLCARQPGLVVAVNYIRRYLPAVQAWQQRIQNADLGELLHGQITYGKGLLTNGSHFVSLAEHWLGPLAPQRLLNPGLAIFGFDREASLELQVQLYGRAPLVVRSVGGAGLRAGELDLWFSRGRLCWRNDGQAIAFWPAQVAPADDTHVPLAAEPELTSSGLEHYQHWVVEALARHCQDPAQAPLKCSLSDGVRTLETLANACDHFTESDC